MFKVERRCFDFLTASDRRCATRVSDRFGIARSNIDSLGDAGVFYEKRETSRSARPVPAAAGRREIPRAIRIHTYLYARTSFSLLFNFNGSFLVRESLHPNDCLTHFVALYFFHYTLRQNELWLNWHSARENDFSNFTFGKWMFQISDRYILIQKRDTILLTQN